MGACEPTPNPVRAFSPRRSRHHHNPAIHPAPSEGRSCTPLDKARPHGCGNGARGGIRTLDLPITRRQRTGKPESLGKVAQLRQGGRQARASLGKAEHRPRHRPGQQPRATRLSSQRVTRTAHPRSLRSGILVGKLPQQEPWPAIQPCGRPVSAPRQVAPLVSSGRGSAVRSRLTGSLTDRRRPKPHDGTAPTPGPWADL